LPLIILFTYGCNGSDKSETSSTSPSTTTTVDKNKVTVIKEEVTSNKSAESKNTTPEKQKNQSAFSWKKLRGQHTQGTISSDDPIRITFNRDVVGDDKVGKDASKIMHINPSIEGKPIFESKSEIVWLPTKKLKTGIEYKVSIKAKGLKDVPATTPPYQFSFRIIPLEFEIKTLGLAPSEKNDGTMLLKGQVLVSDKVKSEALEKILTASQQSKPLSLEWNHGAGGKKHGFTVSGIKQESFVTDVILNWDGKALSIESKGKKTTTVPALNDFKVTKVHLVHGDTETPYVQVDFSNKLEKNQNLKGLVRLAKNKFKIKVLDNLVKIYPNKNLSGSFNVTLSEGIKSEKGQSLKETFTQKIKFDDIKPQVRFVGKGSILPENTTLEIPFEAVSVNAVEVTAFEIYPENMGQFLQVNRLSGGYQVRRTGRFLWNKTIPLTPADPNKWNRYSFDVTEMMKGHKAGLLRLTLQIKREHSSYDCPASSDIIKSKKTQLKNFEDNGVAETSGWDGVSEYFEDYNYGNYKWSERRNPCSESYFRYNSNKTKVSQNFIASNIGLIAKQDANGHLSIISTDIRTSEPLTGVELEVRNFQGQKMGDAKTDGSGFAKIELSSTPFLVIAKKFEDMTYLKVNNKTALSVSHFDVGGKRVKKGIKGYIYGERGVWRPGDDIYLTFVLQDKLSRIPAGHPVTMQLIDPRGSVVETKTLNESVGGFYAFKFKTAEKAETGNWMVKARLGGSTFSKSLMIETVRPNRLKVELDFVSVAEDGDKPLDILYKSDGAPTGELFGQWLHGAKASKLKADVSLRFSPKKTKFGRFTDFNFDDPARRIKSSDKILLEGRLDSEGYLNFEKDIDPKSKAAGLLRATFTTRVFEEGGAFSISRRSIDYHPYENYVGMKLPKGDATRGMLLTDKKHTVEIASLDAKGEPVSLDKVQVKLYKINWKWWWDRSSETLAEYADGKNTGLLQQGIISTVNGKGQWQFSIKYPEWGRYLVRACDMDGKHCTGKTVYIDWPGWAGRAQEQGSGAASRLNFFSDKTAYTVGETAIIQLPAAQRGRALLTVETGSEILEQRWIILDGTSKALAKTSPKGSYDKGKSNGDNGGNEKDNKTKIEIPITAAMSPNAYVHVTLLQPHKDKKNDRPIRLYGIIPLEVTDINTYLLPKVEVAKEWKPETTQKIKITESNGKAMNYTLAVVDEGLLGLTGFKTPNLHKHFYSKEALGIKTWDLFDEVIGAYGGKLERMLALGGGDEANVDNEDSKKRRFPPVVKVLGPFHLDAGATVEHEVTLPPYLGAVRVMVVAGEKGAYGKAQKSVFVRQALMLQASLPRVLGPDEEVSVPLSLFAMNDSVKDVEVTVTTDDLVEVVGDKTQHVSFTSAGEKLAFIKLKTANKTGKTHLRFTATSRATINSDATASTTTAARRANARNVNNNGQHQSTVDIYLDIRRANQETTRVVSKVIEAGDTWQSELKPYGLEGSNSALLELSSVPALNLEKRLKYLIRYPHGCLEQTTSSVFPQLYLSNVMSLTDERKQQIDDYINRSFEIIRRFQQPGGGLNYWPGGNTSNSWASIYAGHYLVEAKKKGYLVPQDLYTNWLSFQISAAQSYVVGTEEYSPVQAYRLYVLALAGKPQMGAMNRLRESSKLNNKARWMLASAYKTASQPDAAKALVKGLVIEPKKVDYSDHTYSSTLGNMGIQLDNLVSLDKKQDANNLVEQIAEQLSGDGYQSTQGIAWALMSVSRYLGGDTSSFSAKISQGKTAQDVQSTKAIASNKLVFNDAPLKVNNTSGIKLFATLINQGVPAAGNEQAVEQGLEIEARYEKRTATNDDANKKQWHDFDISQPILQGSDIRITVTVSNETNRNTKNIALTIPVAAGMEIFSGKEQPKTKDSFDYRDVRDDRIHYYFSLNKGKSKTFQLLVNASYQGRYYLPAINAEAMYDGKMQAREVGKWLNIVKETVEEDTEASSQNSSQDDAQNSSQSGAVKDAADATGNIVEIAAKKAWMYDEPNENSKTKLFLIKEDEAELLQTTKDALWYRVRFKGTKTVEKWIKAVDVDCETPAC